MNNVLEIESTVSRLSTNELFQFSTWLENFMADQWDKKIEADILTGRLNVAETRADDEFVAGSVTPL